MDSAVDENASVSGCISDKESRLVEKIAGVGADHERLSNGLVVIDLGGSIAIRSIKAPGETSHDLEVRVRLGGVDDSLGLSEWSVSGQDVDALEKVVPLPCPC